ncbi:MAG: crossover junction endodeoxyribonuclease RuvC [Fimbriimonadales bacterium]|nr:crossover junction endodeoxyribonuclease RuvC [Fimbriimonadales bacterium]
MPTTVLGIDPGLERVGFGLVRREGSSLRCVEHGLIETPRVPLADRLALLQRETASLLERTRPDAVATEKLLFSVNRKTAMDVAKALGALLAEVGRVGLPWSEYAPSEVKLAVVGNGAAEKRQVEYMVCRLLGLERPPKPDDVADALAIAVCHALRVKG